MINIGDRVSIQFANGKRKSVVLFDHWGGMEFVETAKQYVAELKKERGDKTMMPIDRLEPNTVIVDFIRYLTVGMTGVESSLYLGATENDGDNSDNGHHEIDLNE